MIDLFFLTILYVVSFFVYLYVGVRRVVKNNRIELWDCFILMYSVVYGLIPAVIFFFEACGERNLYYYDYSKQGMNTLLLVYFFSVVAFCVIQLISCGMRRTKAGVPDESHTPYQTDLLKCGIVALIIGFVSLFLWTRAYGSLQNFIINARSIRSGRGKIANKFAFMKQFVKILLISLYALVSALITDAPRGLRKLAYWFLILLAGFGAYLYLLASDSRSSIVFTGVATVLIIAAHKKGSIKKRLFVIGLTFLTILALAMLGDGYTNYVRYGRWSSFSEDWTHSFIREFRYVVIGQMSSMGQWVSGLTRLKFRNDWVNALFAWIPERFIPFSLPETIWQYNTQIVDASARFGISPTDPISTGIYKFGLFGALLQPVLLSVLAIKCDNVLNVMRKKGSFDVYYGALAVAFIQGVRAFQLSNFMELLFPIVLYYFIEKCIKSTKNYTQMVEN